MAIVNENSAGSVLALQAEVRRLREELATHSGIQPTSTIGRAVHHEGGYDRLMELEVLLSKCTECDFPFIFLTLHSPRRQ